MSSVPHQERLMGFDILRSFCFFCIISFHISNALWPYETFPDYSLPLFLSIIAKTVRFGDFSGFAILFLTSFLAGIKRKPPLRDKPFFSFFLFFSWLVFNFISFLQEGEFQIVWDIYPLILLGYLSSGYLLFGSYFVSVCIALLGLLLLWIPVWEWSSLADFFPLGKQMLFGICPGDYADWPILPWIGLIWIGLFLGKTYGVLHLKYGHSFWCWRRWEFFLWAPLFLAFFFCHSIYFKNPLGQEWACYVFRQSPFAFWSQMGCLFFVIRISLMSSVQKFLSRFSFFKWISALYINQAFYFSYFIHYILIYTLVGLIYDRPWLSKNFSILMILILTLLTTEWCTGFFLKLKSKSHRSIPS